jgi:hypothetical protein
MPRSIAKACLRLTGLFEAELLTELILKHWNHPLADDGDFRSALLEVAAQVLRASIDGQRLFDDINPQNVNLVAALWYSESVTVESPEPDDRGTIDDRRKWLETVRRSIPSCFCNPEHLF